MVFEYKLNEKMSQAIYEALEERLALALIDNDEDNIEYFGSTIEEFKHQYEMQEI